MHSDPEGSAQALLAVATGPSSEASELMEDGRPQAVVRA